MGQLTADNPAKLGPTIVGGQPPAKGKAVKGVPVGMERVLFLAAMEPAFREALLAEGANREAVVAERGLMMQPSEAAMLRLVPASQLAANIDGMDTSDDNVERRSFLQAVAASALAVSAVGCGEGDEDVKLDQGPVGMDATGVRPDIPGLDSAGMLSDWPSAGDRPGPVYDMGARPDTNPPDHYVPPPDDLKLHPDMGVRPKDGMQPDQSKLDVKVPSLDATGIRPNKDGS